MVEYVKGRKGDIIIVDREVKRKLGVEKHIVIRNSGNERFEKFVKYATVSEIVKVLRIVGESKNVVFAEVVEDVEVGEKVECNTIEGSYVIASRCTRYVEYLLKGRKPVESWTEIEEVKETAYEKFDIRRLIEFLEEVSKRVRRKTSNEKVIANILRILLTIMGYKELARGECVPRGILKEEAREEMRKLGIEEETIKRYERKGFCVDYIIFWKDEEVQKKLSNEEKKLMKMLGFI